MQVGTVLLQYFRLSWILGLHGLFVALLLSRVLQGTDWSWFLTFIPLFLFDGLAAVYWVFYLIGYIVRKVNEEEEEESVCFPKQTMSIVVVIFYAGGLPLKVAAEILLCFALSKAVPYYVPGILFCLLFLGIGVILAFYSLKPPLSLIPRYC